MGAATLAASIIPGIVVGMARRPAADWELLLPRRIAETSRSAPAARGATPADADRPADDARSAARRGSPGEKGIGRPGPHRGNDRRHARGSPGVGTGKPTRRLKTGLAGDGAAIALADFTGVT